MRSTPHILNAMSRLFSYPDQHTVQAAELLYVLLQGELPEAASQAAQFGAFLEQHELWEAEEAFTRTFDVNPICALEVGWQLFGEEYTRGMFLVRMREELRKYELPETSELPDHITHVLAVVAAMPDDEAQRFVHACVLPAVQKIQPALEKKDTPYRYVMQCLHQVLVDTWGPSASEQIDAVRQPATGPHDSHEDPLRSFPVADVTCGTSCAPPVTLVPLQMKFPTDQRSPVSKQAREP